MTTNGGNKGRHQKWQQGPSQQMSDPQRAEPLGGGRRESSVERSLANMREAHQKALAMVVALEEEIEWLSCPLIRNQPEVRTHSRSRHCWIHGSRGWKRRHCQMQPENCLAPYFKYHPSRRNLESSRKVMATKDPEKAPSPKPPVKELHKWVAWKAEACKTPGWWRELLAVPEVQDCKKLAWEVWASFQLPKGASELHKMENYHQAPPAPPCLLIKNFPATSQFHLHLLGHSRDAKGEDGGIYPSPQYWAEKTDTPAGEKPCLLAESVKEL